MLRLMAYERSSKILNLLNVNNKTKGFVYIQCHRNRATGCKVGISEANCVRRKTTIFLAKK